MYHNIVLVGMMGSGKSTIGRHMASRYDLTFVDTDHLIEAQVQKQIPDIFTTEGEAKFREYETACCESLLGYRHHVIATGGGMILSEQNRHLLRQTGFVVYLQSSVPLLISRLATDDTRPLLHTPDKEKKLHELLTYRHPLYLSTAHISLDSAAPPDMLSKKIWEAYHR